MPEPYHALPELTGTSRHLHNRGQTAEGVEVSRAGKLGIFFSLVALGAGLIVFTAMAFLRTEPPTVDLASNHKPGTPVHLTLQTVGSIGYGVHPQWVSYLVKAPDGKWVQSTLWNLPAHTKIDVTIYQFDSGSPLRNQQIGQVYGVNGGTATLNGKSIHLVNSNVGAGVGHTFSVPSLGINVPLAGVPGNKICGVAPCSTSQWPHNTVQFSFTTPKAGQYRWQCFVPCGLSYLYGNGGPMQTIGYMGGFLKVVN